MGMFGSNFQKEDEVLPELFVVVVCFFCGGSLWLPDDTREIGFSSWGS